MLHLTLFGHFQATWDDTPLPFPTESTRALIAYLALERHKPHLRHHIATLLWPDNTEEQGRHSLRQTLLRLRQTVPDTADDHPLLLVTKDTLQWNHAYPVTVDVHQFEAHMAEAEPFLNTPVTETPYPAFAPLQAATALGHGNLLHGLDLLNDLYAKWLLGWREKYQRQMLNALARLAESYGRAGQINRMERLAQRQLAIAPTNEEAHVQLLRAYMGQGNPTATLTHYTIYQKRIAEEGLSPTAAARQLAQQAQQMREGVPLPIPAIPHNLPPEDTPFYGRQSEQEEILLWLVAPNQQLLTLTGLGGMGKTRLALAAARQLARPWPTFTPTFPNGVWFVPLADVQIDSQATAIEGPMAQAILQACGWAKQQGETAVETLTRYVQKSKVLLILDNLEHLLPHAADFVLQLLRTAPHLTILATSRQRLGLQREVVRALRGLPTPQHDMDTAVASITLFIERVQRVDHRFQLNPATMPHLIRICRVLDGWPIALELTASWAEAMYMAEIAERVVNNITTLHTTMPDLPPRHRSLQAVLEGSYTLLTPAQQHILARVAVLHGGCTAEAAAIVLEATPHDMDSLVRRALLHNQDGRYTVHELIRQFAETKLETTFASAKPTALQTHATYYLNLLPTLYTALHGPDPLTAVNLLRPERENVSQAWHWAIAAESYELLSHALPSLLRFYNLTGLLPEGELLFRHTQTALAHPTHPTLFCDLLLGRINLLIRMGNYEASHHLLTSLPPLATLPPTQQLLAYHWWGEWYALQDHVPEARHASQQALALARTLHNRPLIAFSLARLDMLHEYNTPYQTELLELVEQEADKWLQRFMHSFLGAANIRHGRYHTALTHWQEALTISLNFHEWYTAATLSNNMGDVLRQLGQTTAAAQHYEKALALYDSLSNSTLRMYPLEGQARLCLRQGDYEQALVLAQESYTLAHAHQLLITQITALSCIGHAYVALHRWPQAHDAYAEAAVLLPDLPRWSMESIAGLAYVALHQGDKPTARVHIDHFLALLQTTPLEGSSSPSLTYTHCYEVLLGLGDKAQAAVVLAQAQAWLAEQAASIPTPVEQEHFWANLPAGTMFWQGARRHPMPSMP